LNNYPDPSLIINKYGADAMRYYMTSSPIVQAEPLNFSEKGVDEVQKKIVQRFLNVVSFYDLYKEAIFDKPEKVDEFVKPVSENVLDKWILTRLDQTLQEATDNLDKYQLDNACRPIFDFVDDLSTWYLRRSRDRVKGEDEMDKAQTLQTLSYVIFEFSKMIAPFMPFLAEATYQKMTGYDYKNSDKSVHLLSWTKYEKVNEELLKQMELVRDLVTYSLEARDKAGIKVRQPLQKVSIGVELDEQMKNIIADEINVKEIVFDSELKEKEVKLDTEITPELRQEGNMRELVRFIQAYRKEIKLNPGDKIRLSIKTDKPELVKKFTDYIQKITNASALELSDGEQDGKDIDIDNVKFVVKIKR
jgi:isoleucyl-tRNA synthetase